VRVVDFRVRPPVGGFERATMYAQPERTARMGAAFGFPRAAPALQSASMVDFERERGASGVELAVIPGRVGAPNVGPASNDALVDYARGRAESVCVFPAIDPSAREWRAAADKLLGSPVVRGFTLEPGLLATPVLPDDASCLPVYEFCAARAVPLILSAGGNVGPDCGYTLPVHYDRVARDFPKLNLVIAHGGFPWITQTHHVAFRRGNVYVSPDMYLFMPGNEAYLAAMNSYLSERYLYASSYPFVPLKGYLDEFLKHTASDTVAERVLFGNAARIMGLQ
jgi:predicted TIM-barrel fold metal-dependent hydrolase